MRSGVQNLVFFPLTNFCLHFIQGPRQKLLLSDCQGLPLCSLLITVTIAEGKQLKRRMAVPGLYPNSTRPIHVEMSLNVMAVEPLSGLPHKSLEEKERRRWGRRKDGRGRWDGGWKDDDDGEVG